MSSRDLILEKLRGGKRPFPDSTPPDNYVHMVPLADMTPAALTARFVEEAETLACIVHQVDDDEAALAAVLEIVGEETAVSAWDFSQIPLKGLPSTLRKASVAIAEPDDPNIRVGITGADAALAATGSLVVMSGGGHHRAPSLLPPVHVTILHQNQIVPDMESWWAQQREQNLDRVRAASNVVIISGASRTADIAMELILGMHGPQELHIILLKNSD